MKKSSPDSHVSGQKPSVVIATNKFSATMTAARNTSTVGRMKRKLQHSSSVYGKWVCPATFIIIELGCLATANASSEDFRYDHRTSHRFRMLDSESSDENFSSLSEVWFCLIFGFCWMVWFVAIHVVPDLKRYKTEGVHVWGHVLEVRRTERADGIQTYHALVDYILEPNDSKNDERVYVRKAFQTDTLLERGFANVSLLVLPDDPRSAVIKKQWQRRCDELEAIDRFREKETCPHFSYAKLLGGTVVVLSILGGALRVLHLPKEKELRGWISFVVGVTMMGPCALVTYAIGERIGKRIIHSERRGIILVPPKQSFAQDADSHAYNNLDEDVEAPSKTEKGFRNVTSTKNSAGTSTDTSVKTQPSDDSSISEKGEYYIRFLERDRAVTGRSTASSVSSMGTENSAEKAMFYKVEALGGALIN